MTASKLSANCSGPKIKTKGHKGSMGHKKISTVKRSVVSRPSNKTKG